MKFRTMCNQKYKIANFKVAPFCFFVLQTLMFNFFPDGVLENAFFYLFVSVGADITVSQSLLTQQGVPVIGLSNGKSYCFSLSLETW